MVLFSPAGDEGIAPTGMYESICRGDILIARRFVYDLS